MSLTRVVGAWVVVGGSLWALRAAQRAHRERLGMAPLPPLPPALALLLALPGPP